MHAPFIVNSLTLHFKEESFGQARVKTRFLFLRTSDKPEKQKNVKKKKKKRSQPHGLRVEINLKRLRENSPSTELLTLVHKFYDPFNPFWVWYIIRASFFTRSSPITVIMGLPNFITECSISV